MKRNIETKKLTLTISTRELGNLKNIQRITKKKRKND
jgi:hypothetical protein